MMKHEPSTCRGATISTGTARQPERLHLKVWRKAAAQGQPDAQCNLGIFYYQGTGVSRDRLEGLRLLRRAAEQDHKQAKEVLYRIEWDSRR